LYGDKVSADFMAMSIKASDGYDPIVPLNIFNENFGGTRMVIALEYEGVLLNINEPSGALRAIFPAKANNSWVKMLKTITFGSVAPVQDKTNAVHFIETLGDNFKGSFTKGIINFNGIDISKLLGSGGIFENNQSLYMFMTAFDDEDDLYLRTDNHARYSTSYFVTSSGDPSYRGYPVFDGPATLSPSRVRNVAFVTVGDVALVSFATFFERYAKSGVLAFSSVFDNLNMVDYSLGFVVADLSGNEVNISASVLKSATIALTNGVYVLTYGEESLQIKSFTVK
jgi:hypothetical protein